jgi:hypothetical protein
VQSLKCLRVRAVVAICGGQGNAEIMQRTHVRNMSYAHSLGVACHHNVQHMYICAAEPSNPSHPADATGCAVMIKPPTCCTVPSPCV